MKKTSVATVNLKFMRIPLLLCLFLSAIILTTVMSENAPSLSMNRLVPGILNAPGLSVESSYRATGLFSFLKISKRTDTVEEKTVAKKGTPPETDDKKILTKTVSSGNSEDVKVSNSTDYDLNIEDFLSGEPKFTAEDISVLIVHTHTTESYTPSEKYSYTPTDTDRTRDKNFNTVRVGDEIEKVLTQKGIKVIHDTTINDYPSYNGSYNRSSLNVTNAIKNDPSIKIVLDVHRDAVEGKNGEKTKYTCEADGKTAACVMFVVGSDLNGLSHEDWKTNLNFAATLQSHIQAMYPGLMRPLNFRSERFNQHLAPGAIIVEVGTNGNTLDEAILGAQYFAEGLADYLKA